MDRQMILDLPELEPMIEQSKIEENRALQRSRPLSEKIEESKRILRLAAQMSREYYGEPLMLSYSGGKDSSVLLHLAESCLSNDEFEVQTSHTSLDMPETIYFIRKEFKRLNDKGVQTIVHMPKDKDGNHITMWNLIVKKQCLPTRMRRFCCEKLKENSTPNRLTALGVREVESQGRQGRDIFVTDATNFKKQKYFSFDHAEEVFHESLEIQDENWDCQMITDMKKHGEALCNAIYWWTDNDVWDYIHQENIEVNPLYEKYGLKRIGCIGCPMASISQIKREFELYPKYEQAYRNAIAKMLEARKASGKGDLGGKWKDVDSTFDWWLKKSKFEVEGQMTLFDE